MGVRAKRARETTGDRHAAPTRVRKAPGHQVTLTQAGLNPYCLDEITLTRSEIMRARYEGLN